MTNSYSQMECEILCSYASMYELDSIIKPSTRGIKIIRSDQSTYSTCAGEYLCEKKKFNYPAIFIYIIYIIAIANYNYVELQTN